MTHSPEPWKLIPRPGQTWEDGEFTALDAEENGLEGDPFSGVSTEDWKRIVACVNACKGIPTEDLNRGQLINGRNPAFAGDEDESIASQLNALQNWCVESGHQEADSILCGVLERLGFRKSVEAFDNLRKGYA